jgi:hypothetical protein
VLDPTRDLGHAVVLIKKPFDEQSLVQTVRPVLDSDASTR